MHRIFALVTLALLGCAAQSGLTKQPERRIKASYVSCSWCTGRGILIQVVNDDYPASVPGTIYACEKYPSSSPAFRMNDTDFYGVKRLFGELRAHGNVQPGMAIHIELTRLSPQLQWTFRAEIRDRGLPLTWHVAAVPAEVGEEAADVAAWILRDWILKIQPPPLAYAP